MATTLGQYVFGTTLDANDSTAKERLGACRIEADTTNGGYKAYRYVQAAADTTVANGTVLGYSDVYGVTATSDYDDYAVASQFLGVGQCAITASYYGWVQVDGYHSAVKKKAGVDSIADGTLLGPAADADGVANTAANLSHAQYPLMAVAASNDTADTIACKIIGGLLF